MSVDFWKRIQGHSWSSSNYDLALEYLKAQNKLDFKKKKKLSDNFWKSFKNRLDLYQLISNKVIGIRIRSDQLRVGDLNTANGNEIIIYEVIHPNQIDKEIDKFAKIDKNTSLSPKVLYNKILSARKLGVSRSKVEEYCKNKPTHCKQIQKTIKPAFVKSYRPLYPFQYWQMDFTSLSDSDPTFAENNENHNHILVIIDIFSKFVYLFPTTSESADVVSSILSKLFLNGDIPEYIGCDNAFDTEKVRNLMREFDVQLRVGNPHSPQTQGFVENKNKHVKNLIAAHFIKYKTNIFFDILDHISFNINNTKHSVTGLTPMQLHRGRSINIRHNVNVSQTSDNENLPIEDVFVQDLHKYTEFSNSQYSRNVTLARQRILVAANKREQYHTNSKLRSFVVGDYVRIATFKFRTSVEYQPTQLRAINDRRIISFVNPIRKTDLERHKLPNKYLTRQFQWRWNVLKNNLPHGIENKNLPPDIFQIQRVIETSHSSTVYNLTWQVDPASAWNVEKMLSVRDRSFTRTFSRDDLLLATSDDIELLVKPLDRPSYNQIDIVLPRPGNTHCAKMSFDRRKVGENLNRIREIDALALKQLPVSLIDYQFGAAFISPEKLNINFELIVPEILEQIKTDVDLNPKMLFVCLTLKEENNSLKKYYGRILSKSLNPKSKSKSKTTLQFKFNIEFDFQGNTPTTTEPHNLKPSKYAQEQSENEGWIFADIQSVAKSLGHSVRG